MCIEIEIKFKGMLIEYRTHRIRQEVGARTEP